MSIDKHTVFVLDKNGSPLTPTTPAKARKLLRAGAAIKRWSKFNTFGIQLTTDSRDETPDTSLGVDSGTKFEGFSVVVGTENSINVQWCLPDKKVIVKKLDERRTLRRARRWRNCRRRPARFDNRGRDNWLAPSQAVIVGSRLKAMKALFSMYPISLVGYEDVRFNHAKNRWGANFSTVEIGKRRLRDFWAERGALVFDYRGHETQEYRKRYGYRKTAVKNASQFTAHCSDSLALALACNGNQPIPVGPFVVVDDTYRCKRRRLHDTQPAKGGIRAPYSKGIVFGLRKGLLIGTVRGVTGQLCGEYKGGYRFYKLADNKRSQAKKLAWVSSQCKVTLALPLPPNAALCEHMSGVPALET